MPLGPGAPDHWTAPPGASPTYPGGLCARRLVSSTWRHATYCGGSGLSAGTGCPSSTGLPLASCARRFFGRPKFISGGHMEHLPATAGRCCARRRRPTSRIDRLLRRAWKPADERGQLVADAYLFLLAGDRVWARYSTATFRAVGLRLVGQAGALRPAEDHTRRRGSRGGGTGQSGKPPAYSSKPQRNARRDNRLRQLQGAPPGSEPRPCEVGRRPGQSSGAGRPVRRAAWLANSDIRIAFMARPGSGRRRRLCQGSAGPGPPHSGLLCGTRCAAQLARPALARPSSACCMAQKHGRRRFPAACNTGHAARPGWGDWRAPSRQH